MKRNYLFKRYFFCFIFIVFLIQIIFLAFLAFEHENSILHNVKRLYLSSESNVYQSTTLPSCQEDFRIINSIMNRNMLNIYLIDKNILKQLQDGNKNTTSLFDQNAPLLLALNYFKAKNLVEKIIQDFQNSMFKVVTFFNENPKAFGPDLKNVPIAIVLKRLHSFKILFFHTRLGNFWWFGNIHSDLNWERKLVNVDLSPLNSQLILHEGALEKFEAVKFEFGESFAFIPKNVALFLEEFSDCKFIECDHERAHTFAVKYNVSLDSKAKRFQHKVYKLLSVTLMVAKRLSMPFWLSSGTCLGYFRQCSVIPYTTDVDIGVFIDSYNPAFTNAMIQHGFKLKHKFGIVNDSFELSFLMKNDPSLKLDVFFFYKEMDYYWNGGTQVKSSKKFRYVFPKFHLCWTIFLNLKVQIPCETESYIVANYGEDWIVPIKTWDWKSSPNNVQEAGVWLLNQRKEAVQVF